jgi:hypothetical protein
MQLLSLYNIVLLLLGQYVVANMNGPGIISVNYGGSIWGCLDQNMKWVVDGSCGVFVAKTIVGGSKSIYLPSRDSE